MSSCRMVPQALEPNGSAKSKVNGEWTIYLVVLPGFFGKPGAASARRGY